ncbi:MAG: enoyl-CoA hydratase/isomerase family protein [Actinomycetota bacterium]
MAERVRIELDGPVVRLVLDHPPLNIFDLAMRDDLIGALLAVREMGDLRVMVLAAEGRHFSAGADLSEFGTAASIAEARRIRWDRDPWGLLWDLPIPTIAALHGVAVGSGLEMAMLCDLRVATPTTRLALPETKLGMLPAAGGTQSLTKAVGPAEAVPVVALADEVDPAVALARGMVSVLADDADEEAMAIAERLAGLDPSAMRALKSCLRASVDLPLDAGLAVERRLARQVAEGSAN